MNISNISEGSFFMPSASDIKLELDEIIFYINSWQILGQRIFAEQSSVNGKNLITNCSLRYRRISLEGIWVKDKDPSALILKLEEYISNNTSFTFNLQQMHFSECRLIKYTAKEQGSEPYINISIELLSETAPDLSDSNSLSNSEQEVSITGE